MEVVIFVSNCCHDVIEKCDMGSIDIHDGRVTLFQSDTQETMSYQRCIDCVKIFMTCDSIASSICPFGLFELMSTRYGRTWSRFVC